MEEKLIFFQISKFIAEGEQLYRLLQPVLNLPEDRMILVCETPQLVWGAEAVEEFEFEGQIFMGVRFNPSYLQNLSLDHFIEDLTHELTHIKQFLHDQLIMEEDEETGVVSASFQGVDYRFDNDLEYWLAPWEIEARGMERAGLHMYNSLTCFCEK